MKDVKEIYKDVILNGYYDEAYGMKPEIIDGKTHGVCIDFSRKLIELLRQEGYAAGLISTLNDDGYLHAAVIYKDLEKDIVSIADPVTDIKRITGLNDEEINGIIEEIMSTKNWQRNLREYIKEFGIVTAYNDDLSKSMEQIQDKEELEAIPAINETISKKNEPIQTITSLERIKGVADGPTLLACQSLYKKGISTYCSNYTPNGEISVNINYNSLSPENKQILKELKEKYPNNFYFQQSSGFYGHLETDQEIDENKAMEVIFGYKISSGMSVAQINLEMFNLISRLKKQEYLEGSFTRKQMLDGRHLLDTTKAKLGIDMHCKSNDTNTNEEIAENEGFIYSKKYDRFFKDMATKSRYIESLYREEHDLRTEEEIAQNGGVFYDSEYQMFFESEQELLNYRQVVSEQSGDYPLVSSADIVEADMNRKIPQSKIQLIKIFFENILNKITGKGER